MERMPRRPKKAAGSHPVDPKEMGLRAVEQLQSEVRRIYADIDRQHWSPPQKIAHFHQIFGVFGSWFLASMPPETRVEVLTRMASLAERAAIGSAPRAFHRNSPIIEPPRCFFLAIATSRVARQVL
jgi:hypothetical protein